MPLIWLKSDLILREKLLLHHDLFFFRRSFNLFALVYKSFGTHREIHNRVMHFAIFFTHINFHCAHVFHNWNYFRSFFIYLRGGDFSIKKILCILCCNNNKNNNALNCWRLSVKCKKKKEIKVNLYFAGTVGLPTRRTQTNLNLWRAFKNAVAMSFVHFYATRTRVELQNVKLINIK